MKSSVFLVVIFLLAFQGLARPKYEREIRIKEGDVPAMARSFVDSMNLSGRVRWYKEIGFNRNSIEAKIRSNGQRYSIEFSDDGTFEDVEIEVKVSDILADVYSMMMERLQTDLGRFTIRKVQVQYSGSRNSGLAYFRNRQTHNNIDIHYEIVVSARVDDSFQLMEYLFTATGEFVHRSKVILRNTDNIVF